MSSPEQVIPSGVPLNDLGSGGGLALPGTAVTQIPAPGRGVALNDAGGFSSEIPGVASAGAFALTCPSDGAAAVSVANRAWLAPLFVPTTFSPLTIRLKIAVQSGNYDLGVYDWDLNLLWSLGGAAMPAAAATSVNLISGLPESLTLHGGSYYAAYSADNAVAQISVFQAADIPRALLADTAYPLPASLSGLTSSNTTRAPVMGLFA